MEMENKQNQLILAIHVWSQGYVAANSGRFKKIAERWQKKSDSENEEQIPQKKTKGKVQRQEDDQEKKQEDDQERKQEEAVQSSFATFYFIKSYVCC